MDKFGIGNALKGMAHLLEEKSRRTGRTTTMCRRAEPGDVIIVSTRREIAHVHDILHSMGKAVEVRLYDQENAYLLGKDGRQVHLEHTVVSKMYQDAISEIGHFIQITERKIEPEHPVYPAQYNPAN